MEFGERTRDCSPGHAGKEGPHIAMKGLLVRFLEVRCQDGVSHKIRRGAQGVSRVVTGKSGLHARVEGERVIALESW